MSRKRARREEDIPEDEIDVFHEERDKIYLDEYVAKKQKGERKSAEFMPLSKGQLWSDDEEDDDDEYYGQKRLLEQEKLDEFKEGMASDIEVEDEEGDKSEVPAESWGGKRKNYYGVEEEDEKTEEMSLEECRRLRQEQNQITTNRPTFPPTEFDLFYCTGQSRLPLILAEKPCTREEEVAAWRDHTLPIFALPDSEIESDCQRMKEYLTRHYPELDAHYREYLKVVNWLDKKWEPLSKAYIATKRIKKDSIAGQIITSGLDKLYAYRDALALYYSLRRERQPMMSSHPVNNILKEAKEERNKQLEIDISFMKIAGFLLLKYSKTKKPLKEIASEAPDADVFLRCLNTLKEGVKFEKRQGQSKPQVDLSEATPADIASDSDDGLGSTEVLKDEEEHRPITYEMQKNKGFIPRRNKRDRNPRVKLRHKVRKANIRSRSQVPQVRREESRYGGEVFGIRAGLVKAKKIRV